MTANDRVTSIREMSHSGLHTQTQSQKTRITDWTFLYTVKRMRGCDQSSTHVMVSLTGLDVQAIGGSHRRFCHIATVARLSSMFALDLNGATHIVGRDSKNWGHFYIREMVHTFLASKMSRQLCNTCFTSKEKRDNLSRCPWKEMSPRPTSGLAVR